MDLESFIIMPGLRRSSLSITDPKGMDLECVTVMPNVRRFKSVTDYPPKHLAKPKDLAKLLQPYCEFATRDDRRERADFFINCTARFHHDYPVIRAFSSVLAEHSWSDKWLGITWVALQGIDSMCMVVREDDLLNLKEKLYPGGQGDPKYFARVFWNAIISNVEDIEDFMFGGCNMIPFSVVTVGPGIGPKKSDGQASREYIAKKTSEFLQDEMKSGATFTLEKTVLTAISALQHLFCQEFEAHQIRVFVWKKYENVGRELLQGREIPDLEELLATARDK